MVLNWHVISFFLFQGSKNLLFQIFFWVGVVGTNPFNFFIQNSMMSRKRRRLTEEKRQEMGPNCEPRALFYSFESQVMLRKS